MSCCLDRMCASVALSVFQSEASSDGPISVIKLLCDSGSYHHHCCHHDNIINGLSNFQMCVLLHLSH
jgi:hypothetical protein